MAEATNPRKHAAAVGSMRHEAAASGPRPPPRAAAHPRQPEAPEIEQLTVAQMDDLRTRLESRRDELRAGIEGRRREERDTGREVGDEMDEASLEGSTSMTSRLIERNIQLLAEIERALEKMREGTYGLCEGTGESIGYARLSHQPWARYSIAYQEELEREERTRGQ
jgi:DnaK suppressor protein